MRRAPAALALGALGALALAPGAARAQESTFTPDGANCADPSPIVGTAGVRNSQQAIQANANTYSASAFANRYLTSSGGGGSSDDWTAAFALDLNVTYGAAQLVSYHPKSVTYGSACEAKWRVVTKPLDLQAANVGAVLHKGDFGIVYATSFTYAAPAYGDQFTRLLMTSAVAPAYVLSLAAMAPAIDLLVPGPMDFSTQTTAYRLEWMLGATLTRGSVHAAATYLSSGGGFFQASEEHSGAYAFAALRFEGAPVFQGGLDRLDLGEAVGLSSAAYQDIPFLLMGARSLEAREALQERLRVGSIQQQNMGGVFDLNARYRIAPDPSVSELSAGIHTPGYHRPRTGAEEEGFRLLAQGGFVALPPAWSQGLAPVRLPSARVATGAFMGTVELTFSIYMNDPEQLQLYPFARNAVSYQFFVGGGF